MNLSSEKISVVGSELKFSQLVIDSGVDGFEDLGKDRYGKTIPIFRSLRDKLNNDLRKGRRHFYDGEISKAEFPISHC